MVLHLHVPKWSKFRIWRKTCTEVVCTEMVMYRTGPNPCDCVTVKAGWVRLSCGYTWRDGWARLLGKGWSCTAVLVWPWHSWHENTDNGTATWSCVRVHRCSTDDDTMLDAADAATDCGTDDGGRDATSCPPLVLRRPSQRRTSRPSRPVWSPTPRRCCCYRTTASGRA